SRTRPGDRAALDRRRPAGLTRVVTKGGAMTTVLTNARIFTGTGEEAREGSAIGIADGKVAWIGDADDPRADGDALDCEGATIVPGLIDAHAHLDYSGVTDPYSIELAKPLEEATIDAALNAQ